MANRLSRVNPELVERLKKIEEKWQKEWQRHKVYEADPDESKKKFFVTFPYPYVNAFPHLGSAFTVLRVDVTARYKRMRGYNVLFPQGWHATGGPIVANALRLREGDEKIRRLLLMMGVPESEIDKFTDPAEWVRYFSKGWRRDLSRYGMSIDWRREFYTTMLNPFYSKFIEWQYYKLKEKGLVAKGEHPVVWCPREKKVVGDHDRPDEYAGISPVEAVIIKFKDVDGYVYPALTYRPETVFGVTNIWVNPDAEYLIAEVDGETWYVSEYMAHELADQKHAVKMIGRISGRELIGRTVKSPVQDKWVPVLPASFVDPDIGTGIVMSVPAHAPFDLVALEDLKKSPEILEEFGIDPSIVASLEPIPLIKVEGYSSVPARDAVKKYGVVSQKDKEKLDKATKEIYTVEFHKGVLLDITGRWSGKLVSEAKDDITSWLVEEGLALRIYTLPEKVYCRCGARTHVKLVSDQWFLLYSNKRWKELAHKAVDRMNFYPEQAREWFHRIIDWYKDWAFTHQRELGTPLPWDPDWVVESLSDSTIYMAYYTVAKYLQHPEVYGIKPEQLIPEVFDYIFLGRGDPKTVSEKSGIPVHLLEAMRREFTYWYPVDLRISGKDLMQNHLVFFIFHHTAIFPEAYWPRGIGLNGWVLVRGEKMAKSKGNFILLRDALEAWGADATRWAETLAGADPGLDDANFEPEVADNAVEELIGWMNYAINNYGKGRDERAPIDEWFESVLNRAIIKVTELMDQTKYKTALVEGYYNLQSQFKWYLRRAGTPQKEVLKRFIEVQTLLIAPFAPHVAEEIWRAIGKDTFIVLEKWPEPDIEKINEDMEKAEMIVQSLLEDVKEILRLVKHAKQIYIVIADDWKYDLLKKVKDYRDSGMKLREAVRTAIREVEVPDKKLVGKIIQLITRNPEILTRFVNRDTELNVLGSAKDFLKRELGIEVVVLLEKDAKDIPKSSLAMPAKPAIYVETGDVNE